VNKYLYKRGFYNFMEIDTSKRIRKTFLKILEGKKTAH